MMWKIATWNLHKRVSRAILLQMMCLSSIYLEYVALTMLKSHAPSPWWRHWSNRWRRVLVSLHTQVNGESVSMTCMQKPSSYSNPPLRKTVKVPKTWFWVIGMGEVNRSHSPQMTFRDQVMVCTLHSEVGQCLDLNNIKALHLSQ